MDASRKSRFLMLFCLAVLSLFVMAGCKGDTGPAGATGSPGQTSTLAAVETCIICHDQGRTADPAALHPGLQTPAAVTSVITSVTVSGPTGTGVSFVVNFSVTGPGVLSSLTGTTTQDSGNRLASIRLGYAKLVPAANAYDADIWVSYTTGDRDFRRLTDLGGGNYRYISSVFDTTTLYDPAVLNRVMLLVYGTAVADPQNTILDFVPSGGPVPATRDIVTTAACNECHNKLLSPLSILPPGDSTVHSGARFETKACAVCHTTTLGGGAAEFAPMIHKIHAAKSDFGLGDFSEVTLPQALFNCQKCHKGAANSTNYATKPTTTACATCHDIVFSQASVTTGFTLHSGGTQANNAGCASCHPNNFDPVATNYAPILTVHQADDSSPNNPIPPAGAQSFAYEISSVTVTNNQPVVTFRIKTGPTFSTTTTPVSLVCNTRSSTSNNRLLVGYSGSPSFLVAYAMPQDGVTTMTDYNNLGKAAGQPASVSIANICNETQGTMSAPTPTTLFYTATLRGSNNAGTFPAGAKLRAVALQGYFTQNAGTSGLTTTLARHAISVQKNVTGDIARRTVVDPARCGLCHEFFQGHGGNRVYETQVCVICHVPNLSSSGRGANVANLDATNAAALTAAGYDAANPAAWPETSQNFKDLIHSAHASAKRAKPFQFVRDRGTSGVYYYDLSEITFPGVLSDCETCHFPGTYDVDMPSVLPSTYVTTDGNAATTVTQDRASLPNANDLVTSPTTATCIACHDADLSVTHTLQNGASILVPRSGQ